MVRYCHVLLYKLLFCDLLQGENGTFKLTLEGDDGIFSVQPDTVVNEASVFLRVEKSSKLDYQKITQIEFFVSCLVLNLTIRHSQT